MASCQQTITLVGRYLDGEALSKEQVTTLTEHIDQCSQCSDDFLKIQQLTSKIRHALEPTRLTDQDKQDLKTAIFKEIKTEE